MRPVCVGVRVRIGVGDCVSVGVGVLVRVGDLPRLQCAVASRFPLRVALPEATAIFGTTFCRLPGRRHAACSTRHVCRTTNTYAAEMASPPPVTSSLPSGRLRAAWNVSYVHFESFCYSRAHGTPEIRLRASLFSSRSLKPDAGVHTNRSYAKSVVSSNHVPRNDRWGLPNRRRGGSPTASPQPLPVPTASANHSLVRSTWATMQSRAYERARGPASRVTRAVACKELVQGE